MNVFVGLIYYSLANLDPALRSQLAAIHLACAFKYSLVEVYGIDTFIKPFLDDVQKLSQVCFFVSCQYIYLNTVYLANWCDI